MNKLLKGISYSFFRNIGWQDRALRTIVGIAAVGAAIYFYETHRVVAVTFSILAAAQIWTVLSARCIICYFTGQCTISPKERSRLSAGGTQMEMQHDH